MGNEKLNGEEEDSNDSVDYGTTANKPYTVFGNDIPNIEPDPHEEIVFEKEGLLSIVKRKMKRVFCQL